jgi:cell fate regulator YaaT (PSP1 superfamily)
MSEIAGEAPPFVAESGKGRCTGVVRYGYMNLIGEFVHPDSVSLHCQDAVVVQTERGIELGKYVSYTCPKSGFTRIEREQIERYVTNSGPDYLRPKAGRVLRVANDQDLEEHRRIVAGTKEKLRFCTELTEQYKLPMKMVACEHIFGGERIIFYFLSESRVDFRELVKDLAREYQTRIEMRQVGARDEARLVADYEICGRECCCKNFLKTLRPVNMKMAKLQKATLDPSKVSGRCGRLRCCLRYEHESYQQLAAKLPRVGHWVLSEHGNGKVTDTQVLTQLVQFETADGRKVTIGVEEIDEVQTTPPPEPPPAEKVTHPEPRRRPDRRRPSPPAEPPEPPQEPGPTEKAEEEEPTDQPQAEQQQAGPSKRRRRRGRRRRRSRPDDSSAVQNDPPNG